MFSTESVDDSRKMTGRLRSEVLGIKEGKDSRERGGGGRSGEEHEEKSDDKSCRGWSS